MLCSIVFATTLYTLCKRKEIPTWLTITVALTEHFEKYVLINQFKKLSLTVWVKEKGFLSY